MSKYDKQCRSSCLVTLERKLKDRKTPQVCSKDGEGRKDKGGGGGSRS